ncbi:hypothetical protein TREMEDRAFT_31892 [Tremella mesenterica DSM 1558]|uniref:uncharacterized protein n=1 Tax=Tremella mesenterica (strain ATCC 24925 / CBS 8224 / DSM 1558 / NBRC 9311 / NRRL Y-6157 / RJB 2259-6 / UBC 559-6) TaxID=578456 RepID=UPI0003F49766|nr:uncharacterized protein TREMEDRAFT_31892 [Tremella mesenterica DSM 1558]EIW68554.1 hypothetical protein TREMEDRAFT_31892 [Tremella mesenterica DSM 1558]
MASNRADRFAALKKARKEGGRLSQWKPGDGEIYDTVSDEQYRSIVGDRLEKDDFIVDDDGNGYVDNGVDDWEDEREEESSEDEDHFEGEDEELRKARKLKKAKARARAQKKSTSSKPKPKSALSDYARPIQSTSTYRPAPSAIAEDDFMASLLSSVTSVPSVPSQPAFLSDTRKRKSSPDIPMYSSDGIEPSSEESFFSKKRYGDSSDVEEEPRMTMTIGNKKKPRISEMTIVPDKDMEMDMHMETVVKEERISDDEDEGIKVQSKPLAQSKINGNSTRRKMVNSTSVKVKQEIPVVHGVGKEVETKEEETPSKVGLKKIIPGATHWSSLSETLAPKTQELETVTAPVGSIKQENVLEEDGTLRMFWLDFIEQDGVVHLVGKVLDRQSGKYVSACVSVNGIQRNLFVKPRPKRFSGGHETDLEVTKTDVYQDFDKARQKAGVEEWAAKFVQRKYAFEEKDVPKGESEWLKVVYGFDQPEMPMDCQGPTFSRVFGTNTSAFELLVIKRKIMGPCWLEIKGPVLSTKATSWCKIEFHTSSPKNVNPLTEDAPNAPKDIPPLTITSISLRTIVNHRENKTEILCATTRTWESCNIDDPTPPDRLPSTLNTIVRPIEKFPPNLESRAKTERSPFQTVKAERALLNSLLATIQRHDPDVIVGHNFLGNGFEALLYRMKELKADRWSRIGRFRRKTFNISKAGNNVRLMAGRLVADLSSDAAKGMISSTTWSLTEMCGTHLKIQREDIDPEDTHGYFDHTLSGPEKLIKFIRLCEVDSYFQMAIAARVQMLPLTKQLTNLAGNSWNLTLNGGRAVRNEFILLHEFHRLKYVCPDKTFKKTRTITMEDEDEEVPMAKRGKAKYAGGLVFDPKKGLWDTYILVMDFNSLYPSIIQEYNIDFTTVEREPVDEEGEEDKIPDVPGGEIPQGVLPRIIATLVGRRKQVKALMKDKNATAAQLQQYDIRQQALKLTANSMYGCLGFQGSRFSSRPLAALTTYKGREILTHTRELAESLQLDVVYGDTDSVFVNSNVTSYPEALKIANDFKKLVNERYRLLEIDLDAVFERILLLNKKKYAAVKIDASGDKTTEVKGLDMKRREFAKISKDASAAVLKEILSGQATEVVVEKIHEYLTSLGETVRSGGIPLEDFIIFKRLGKNPEDYPDKKSQPHVQVALRMKSKGVAVRAHDVIPYIMCLGEDGKSAKSAHADRAFHPDDLRRQGSELRIDFDFYLDGQILQPVLRLCESIEGTDRARLAECLGLDPTRYATHTGGEVTEKQFFTFESQISDKERFKDASPLSLRCIGCHSVSNFEGLLDDSSNMLQPTGLICPVCSSIYPTPSISVQMENQIRAHVARYYLGYTICDGEGCGARTRMMGVYGRRCLGLVKEGCKGVVRLEYSDQKLHDQLLYFHTLFNTDKALSDTRGGAKYEELRALLIPNLQAFNQITRVAQRYLDKNGRRFVDLKGLFGFMERVRI